MISEYSINLIKTIKNNNNTFITLNLSKLKFQEFKIVLEALNQNKSIQKLTLEWDEEMVDEGWEHLVEALEQNKTIWQLNLSCNKMGDTGCKYIAKILKWNKTIRQLNLSCNKIGDTGCKYIADALNKNKTTIEKLDLSHNNIGAKGYTYIAEVLEQNKPNLRELDLVFNNKIGEEDYARLAGGLKYNQYLTVLDLSPYTSDGPGCTRYMQNIKKKLEVNKEWEKRQKHFNTLGGRLFLHFNQNAKTENEVGFKFNKFNM